MKIEPKTADFGFITTLAHVIKLQAYDNYLRNVDYQQPNDIEPFEGIYECSHDAMDYAEVILEVLCKANSITVGEFIQGIRRVERQDHPYRAFGALRDRDLAECLINDIDGLGMGLDYVSHTWKLNIFIPTRRTIERAVKDRLEAKAEAEVMEEIAERAAVCNA